MPHAPAHVNFSIPWLSKDWDDGGRGVLALGGSGGGEEVKVLGGHHRRAVRAAVSDRRISEEGIRELVRLRCRTCEGLRHLPRGHRLGACPEDGMNLLICIERGAFDREVFHVWLAELSLLVSTASRHCGRSKVVR